VDPLGAWHPAWSQFYPARLGWNLPLQVSQMAWIKPSPTKRLENYQVSNVWRLKNDCNPQKSKFALQKKRSDQPICINLWVFVFHDSPVLKTLTRGRTKSPLFR